VNISTAVDILGARPCTDDADGLVFRITALLLLL
jgi:hypothetical protein